MKEIISIQIGGCGVRMGEAIWRENLIQHDISDTGICENPSSKMGSYFCELDKNKFYPRSLMIDTDSEVIDSVRAAGKLYRCDSLLNGKCGCGGSAAVGRCSSGVQLVDPFMDSLRKEIEYCDSLSGFMIFNSISGGTGSGVTTLLLEELENEFPSTPRGNLSVFPDNKIGECFLEPYNAILALHYILEFRQ